MLNTNIANSERKLSIENQHALNLNDPNNHSMQSQNYNIYKSLEEKARLLRQNKLKCFECFIQKINPFSGMSSTRRTICALISIPLFFMLIASIISFMIILDQTNQILDQYIDNLYQTKQNYSRIQNNAIIIQLNSQLQNIAWSSYCIDKFQRSVLFLDYQYINLNFSVDAYNIQETLLDQNTLDFIIQQMKISSPFFSFWQNKQYNEDKNFTDSMEYFLYYQSVVNVFVRPVLLNSYKMNQLYSRQIQIADIFFGSEYDGSFFSNFLSSAYEVYDPTMVQSNNLVQQEQSNGCQYVYFQAKDIRTFEWFTKSIQTKYLNPIQPQVYLDPCSNKFKASLICQRSQTYYVLSKKPFSVMCNSFNIDSMAQYFSEYSLYSDFSLVVDPASLKVVYYSAENSTDSASIKFLKEYSFFMDDIDPNSDQQEPTYSIISEIQDYFSQINSQFFSQVNLYDSFDTTQSQKVIKYTKNNSEYEIIINAIRVYSKINYVNETKGYQLVNLFMFLDVLSKETLISEGVQLKKDVNTIEIILISCNLFFVGAFILRATKHALDKSNLIDIPISNLTEILQTIQFQSLLLQTRNIPNGIDMVDIDNLNEMAESYHSYETKILFESFQNLFDMLRFTTQELYQQNDGLALLNLCNQVKHFEKFKNLRALGICHNNIGNIHYNNQRYIESLQEYQKAIIYSQYELKCYQEQIQSDIQNIKTKKSSSIQSSKITDKGKLKAQILQVLNDENLENGQLDLYWNLFNRKFNFLKSFIMYIESNNSQNQYFWEDALVIIEEIYEISNVFLIESTSRLVLLNHFKYLILNKLYKISNEQFLQVSLNNEQIIRNILQNQQNVNQNEDENHLSLNSNQINKSPSTLRAKSPVLQKLKAPNKIQYNNTFNTQQNIQQTHYDNKLSSKGAQTTRVRNTKMSQTSQNNQNLNLQYQFIDLDSKNAQPKKDHELFQTQQNLLYQNEEDFFGIKLLQKLQENQKNQRDHSFNSIKTIKEHNQKNYEHLEQALMTQQTQPLTTRQLHKGIEETPKMQTLLELNDVLNTNFKADNQGQEAVTCSQDQKDTYKNVNNETDQDRLLITQQNQKDIFDNIIENDNRIILDYVQDNLQSEPSNRLPKIGINSQLNQKLSSNQSSDDRNYLSNEQEEQFKDQSPSQSPILNTKEYIYPNIFLSPPQTTKLSLINKHLLESQLQQHHDIKSQKAQTFSHIHPERDKEGKEQIISFSLKKQGGQSFYGRSKQDTFYQSAYFVQPEQQTIQFSIQNGQHISKEVKETENLEVNNIITPPTKDQITLAKVSPQQEQFCKINIQNYHQITNSRLSRQSSFNIIQRSPLLQKNCLFNNQFIFESMNNLKKASISSQFDNQRSSLNNKKSKHMASPPLLKIGSFRNLKNNSKRPSRFSVGDKNIAYYEFPEDILCQYVLDVDSDILIKEEKYLLAAKLLTTCFEQSQVYFPQLKYSQLCKLKNIFLKHNIKSDYLSNMINSFNPNIKFKIQFVSFCTSNQGKFESISIVQAIIDQIIIKNDDKFGFINYQDSLFQQIIPTMTKFNLEKYKKLINMIIDVLQPAEIVNEQLEVMNQMQLDDIQVEAQQNIELNQLMDNNNLCQKTKNNIKPNLKKQKTQQQIQIDSKLNNSFYSRNIPSQSFNSIVQDQKQAQKITEEVLPEPKQIKRGNIRRQTTRQYSLIYNEKDQNSKPQKRQQRYNQNSEQFSLFTENKADNEPFNLNQSFQDEQQTSNQKIQFRSSHNLKVPSSNLNAHLSQKNIQPQQQQQQLRQMNKHQRSSFFHVQEAHQSLKETQIIQAERDSFGPKIYNNYQISNVFDQKKNFQYQQSNQRENTQNINFIQQQINSQNNFLFHLGIRKALLSFQDLIYQTKNCNQQKQVQSQTKIQLTNHIQNNSKNFFQMFKYVQKQFIVFSTDFSGIFIGSLFNKLKETLYQQEVKLLILLLNEQDSTEEYSQLPDQYHQNECVIKFFYDGQKLLQYLYNQRETKNIHLFPLIVEHY
ncbi:transmembrane protein, putative (macronuclear) [Tetrahymena thermophila SB210]|uniref:Transmembrane protein, putative n=1 Tax=Tetrahymena thermophila (strain SB210) TaxID=312017 RepID=Q245R5_TETTS|nr:transmembrane protein, putative [Tetrahymena thermophila SB210]EAS03568.3 transmembrane protein, putative [Tetrahymena thermophila SB210]|eukprot:XP_001023813.3 transmembrane protein, putative [Tetrahymena thermophila SB210]